MRIRVSGLVLSKQSEAMHPLVENGDDADVTVIEQSPVDEMLLESAEVPVNPKLAWNLSPRQAPFSDTLETLEEAVDILFGLRITPSRFCVDEDLVNSV